MAADDTADAAIVADNASDDTATTATVSIENLPIELVETTEFVRKFSCSPTF